MIQEDKLKEAAEEAGKVLLDSLPDGDILHHTFSKQFKKKMRKLLWKEKYPIIYYGVKSVACVLGAVILSGALLLACSEDARAAMRGWIKELRGDLYLEYFFEDTNTNELSNVKYGTSWVPRGYALLHEEMVAGDYIYIYMDELGNLAQFTYAISPEINNAVVYVDGNSPDYQYIETQVGKYKADLYYSITNNHTSTLIWTDKNDSLFVITGKLEKEELIKWAESVVEIKEK